jgi:hypothetical protein
MDGIEVVAVETAVRAAVADLLGAGEEAELHAKVSNNSGSIRLDPHHPNR